MTIDISMKMRFMRIAHEMRNYLQGRYQQSSYVHSYIASQALSTASQGNALFRSSLPTCNPSGVNYPPWRSHCIPYVLLVIDRSNNTLFVISCNSSSFLCACVRSWSPYLGSFFVALFYPHLMLLSRDVDLKELMAKQTTL